jgi:branched-chain amino acid transport system permease protein
MTAFQVINGLTFAALLFVVASGFTLIFGVLPFVNLAHGALYLTGGYTGVATSQLTGRRTPLCRAMRSIPNKHNVL